MPKKSKQAKAKKRKTSKCDTCGQICSITKLKECGRCKLTRYCSITCQKEAWIFTHRQNCKPPHYKAHARFPTPSSSNPDDDLEESFSKLSLDPYKQHYLIEHVSNQLSSFLTQAHGSQRTFNAITWLQLNEKLDKRVTNWISTWEYTLNVMTEIALDLFNTQNRAVVEDEKPRNMTHLTVIWIIASEGPTKSGTAKRYRMTRGEIMSQEEVEELLQISISPLPVLDERQRTSLERYQLEEEAHRWKRQSPQSSTFEGTFSASLTNSLLPVVSSGLSENGSFEHSRSFPNSGDCAFLPPTSAPLEQAAMFGLFTSSDSLPELAQSTSVPLFLPESPPERTLNDGKSDSGTNVSSRCPPDWYSEPIGLRTLVILHDEHDAVVTSRVLTSHTCVPFPVPSTGFGDGQLQYVRDWATILQKLIDKGMYDTMKVVCTALMRKRCEENESVE